MMVSSCSSGEKRPTEGEELFEKPAKKKKRKKKFDH
jgi:hypothetical protein